VPEALVGRPLAAGRLQGGELRFTGDLVRAGFLVLHRPGRYRVISRDTHGRAVTLCYLVGRDEQLGPLDGATVRVEGPAWWVAGLPHPAVQVRRLVRVE
jgi:hypothetical protein